MSQKQVWLKSEGDAWLERNRDVINQRLSDPVTEAIEELKLEPKRILEVGASNGWRLRLLQKRYEAICSGVEPSLRAVQEARTSELDVRLGTADDLTCYADGDFDLLIYSWVLCLCDRRDLARIVAEGDRVLANSGYLLIYDVCVEIPYKNRWKHDLRLWCHKMDYRQLFTWNPSYSLIYHRLNPFQPVDERMAVSIFWKFLE